MSAYTEHSMENGASPWDPGAQNSTAPFPVRYAHSSTGRLRDRRLQHVSHAVQRDVEPRAVVGHRTTPWSAQRDGEKYDGDEAGAHEQLDAHRVGCSEKDGSPAAAPPLLRKCAMPYNGCNTRRPEERSAPRRFDPGTSATYGHFIEGATRHARPLPRATRRGLPQHAPVAPAGRQGDRAQAAEQDLLPDLERGARGGHHGGRHAAEAGLRLVLPLLPRPRALPAGGDDRRRDAVLRRRRRHRPEFRRPADAVALGPQEAQHRLGVVAHGHAVPAGGRRRRGDAAREAERHHRGIPQATRSCSARRATARRARASSGSR